MGLGLGWGGGRLEGWWWGGGGVEGVEWKAEIN